METISIINLKGGCGKTTLALALIYKGELMKKRVLAIDFDGQCNLTENFDLIGKKDCNALSLLDGSKTIDECIFKVNDYISIIPAVNKLSIADKILNDVGKELKLREVLEEVKEDYDYCILDNPPALGVCVINSLVASDYSLIPIKSGDIYSLSAIPQVVDVINNVKKYYNKNLELLGFVINEYKSRSSFDNAIRETLEEISDDYKLNILDNQILKSTIIEQNKNSKDNIFLKNRTNKAVVSLDNLTDEVFNLMGK